MIGEIILVVSIIILLFFFALYELVNWRKSMKPKTVRMRRPHAVNSLEWLELSYTKDGIIFDGDKFIPYDDLEDLKKGKVPKHD